MSLSCCYGILVDVSGSMKQALSGSIIDDDDVKTGDNKQTVSRSHAVFRTVFKTIQEDRKIKKSNKHDDDDEKVPESDTYFASAFGLCDAAHQHCDLLSLFENVLSSQMTRSECVRTLNDYGIRGFDAEQYIHQIAKYDLDDVFEIVGHQPLIEMAKANGAPYAGPYMKKHLSIAEAGQVFMHFHQKQYLIPITIHELPEQCKSLVTELGTRAAGGVALILTLGLAKGVVDNLEKDSAQSALHKAVSRIEEPVYDVVKEPRSHRDASAIVDRLCSIYGDGGDDSKENIEGLDVDKLLQDIKKKIYGGTPMCKSIQNAQQIFELPSARHQKKRLLIISDGAATDGSPILLARALRDRGVTLMCCFITDKHIPDSRQLYGEQCRESATWSEGAQIMFEMASTVHNSDSSLAFLLKSEWQLSPSGESKLFIQANHPDVIEQFCAALRHIEEFDDALIDMIGHCALDKCINNEISETEAPQQSKKTCYANAVAMGLRLTMSRIRGRDGGYPEFEQMKQAIVEKYGTNGAKTPVVLNDVCPQYRLRCSVIDGETNVRQAISQRRTLVARFALSFEGWNNFHAFYQQTPNGILTRADIQKRSGFTYFKILEAVNDLNALLQKGAVLRGKLINEDTVKLPRQSGLQDSVFCSSTSVRQIDGHSECGGGHAVLLVRCYPDRLVFMNSFGRNWANNGFFSVADIDALGKMSFFDIHWRVDDLSENEENAYRVYCRENVQKLVQQHVPSMVNRFRYQCPNCQQFSKIEDYEGDIFQAICPKCNESFKPNGKGLLRSLYHRQIS